MGIQGYNPTYTFKGDNPTYTFQDDSLHVQTNIIVNTNFFN